MLLDPTIKEAFILASRGASKTYDLVKAYLYYASIGFHMVFFSATAPMMAQPKWYLNQLCKNTFLRYTIDVDNMESKIFKNGGWFLIRNLTEANIRGLHIDGIAPDEICEAKSDEVINAATPTLSTSKLGIIRYLTTPKLGSPAHTVWKRMSLDSPENQLIRLYTECPYIQLSAVEHARKTYPDWYFRQEYLCEWTAPAGRIFTNVLHADFTTMIEEEDKLREWVRTHNRGGLDWNPAFGHVLVIGRYNRIKTKHFVVNEINLGTDAFHAIEQLFTLLEEDKNFKLEIEDGGTNSGYCDMLFAELIRRHRSGEYLDEQYKDISKRIYRRPWDSMGKNKMKSITALYPLTIYVDDARTPMTSEWLDKASWDKEDTSGAPKVLKDPEMHWFDAFLHEAWCGMHG